MASRYCQCRPDIPIQILGIGCTWTQKMFDLVVLFSFDNKRVIIRQGQRAENFYMVLSGEGIRIKVFRFLTYVSLWLLCDEQLRQNVSCLFVTLQCFVLSGCHQRR